MSAETFAWRRVPAISIDHARAAARRRGLTRRAGLLVLLIAWSAWAPIAAALELRLTAEELVWDSLRLESIQFSFGADRRFEVRASGSGGPGERWLAEGLALSGTLREWTAGSEGVAVSAELSAWGLNGTAYWSQAEGGGQLRLDLAGQPVAALRGLPGSPEALGWATTGDLDAHFTWDQMAGEGWRLDLEWHGLAFDSPDGRFAGEALNGSIEVAGAEDFAELELDGQLAGGQLLLDDFYRDFGDGGLSWTATAHAAGDGWVIAPLSLRDDGALAIDATLAWGVEGLSGMPSVQINRLDLRFPDAYHRYIESSASVYALDGLVVTGGLSWHGEWAGGGFRSGDLGLTDISVVDVARERFALTGLDARLRPGDHEFDSSLRWAGLVLGRINLGAGRAEIDSEPGAFALRRPLSLEVMGGRVDIERLRVDLPLQWGEGNAGGNDQPDVLLRARLADLDVERMTRAFGWPVFSGRLSGEIPDVTLDDGVLELDGEIRVEVFDGRLALRDLRIERPFGVLPSLAAAVEVQSLDLEQLTSTFEFGRISGRLDGYVRDLRMLDWRPVAFDAWVGTPDDAGRAQAISRQAVNRLTAIGGGSAAAALSNPVLRMFSNFSYRRIGLGCRLSNNVCALRGLADDGEGVVILEGAGVPKITIRAFNRNLDWPRMVSNLVAVSAGESIVVGKPPPEP